MKVKSKEMPVSVATAYKDLQYEIEMRCLTLYRQNQEILREIKKSGNE